MSNRESRAATLRDRRVGTQLKNQPLCLHSTLGGQGRDAHEFGQSPSRRAAQGQTSSSGPSCRKLPCISCVQPPRFSKPCRKLFTISLFSSLGTFINKRTRKYVVGGEQGLPRHCQPLAAPPGTGAGGGGAVRAASTPGTLQLDACRNPSPPWCSALGPPQGRRLSLPGRAQPCRKEMGASGCRRAAL